ncbi:LLGL scribble cell polarity complex component 2-like [Dysidea avara]|uniref:LLGL scribble cell polarity complex component 2-like n=1 Tax=Dysidea avara TaxID=196820 RepID=UPI003316918B
MKRLRSRRTTGGLKVPEISGDNFSFMQSAFHGFPHKPTAISYEKDYHLLAVGTKTGEFRVYGRPGLELKSSYASGAAIQKIYSFANVHQFITLCADNCIVLWHISMDSSSQDGPVLQSTNHFNMNAEGGKTITACCLSQLTGHFYIGTSSGNVFTLDLRSFRLTEEVIFWDQATALIQPAAKTHPGSVKGLEICPSDHNKLLIGYEKGVIVLWDLEKGLPSKNYPSSIADSMEPIECVCWQAEGQKFMSAHTNGGICTWSVSSSSPENGPVKHYGENCEPISNIKWLDSEQNPMLIFCGGLPQEHSGDHHAITIMHGVQHVALDFSSPVVDIFAIYAIDSDKGEALLVLCEEELLAFDLQTFKFPEIQKPYLHSIHASPVTVVEVYDNCSRHLYEKLVELGPSSQPSEATCQWPVMGGCIKTVEPPSYTLLITGHENGTVKFWDATSVGMGLIYELKTKILFVGMEDEHDSGQSEYSWPPYRSVGKFDPFGDDPRLAIQHIKFCQLTQTLCVGGAGGQVITFSLNTTQSDVKLETSRVDIVKKNDKRYKWGGEGPLECRTDTLSLHAGFQATFCMQCKPPAPIIALDFQPSWGLVAAGTCHGFAVGNFFLKAIVLNHCTILEENESAGNVTRMQSLRRSFRNSFRRRRSTRSGSLTLRTRASVEESTNTATAAAIKRQRQRATSEPAPSVLPDSDGMPLTREQQSVVTNVLLAETYVTGTQQVEPCLFAATAGSVVIRYTLNIPAPEERLTRPTTGLVLGKDYTLLHQAPIVSVFILDHVGLPLASLYEVDNEIVPPPAQTAPHFVVVVTEEQIKIALLPSLKTKKKEKVSDFLGQRIRKAFTIRVKVPGAPPKADRDWNSALLVITNLGSVLVYSLPELKQCYRMSEFLNPGDRKALKSAVVSCNGELFHLRSFSELQRSLFCTYNYSYHSTLAPNLFPFEGSTPGVKRTNSMRSGNAFKVDVENSPQQSPGRRAHIDVRLEPIAPPDSPSARAAINTAIVLEPIKDEQEVPPSPQQSPGEVYKSAEVTVVTKDDDIKTELHTMHEVKETKTEEVETGPEEKENTEEMRQAQAYLESVGGGPHTINVTADKDLIASAQAFTKTSASRKSSTSSSSSSDSSSSSSSSSQSPGQSDLNISTDADIVVGNAAAFEFGDLENESSQLDEIIQSSLRQVENAREFYEEMQKRVILKSD